MSEATNDPRRTHEAFRSLVANDPQASKAAIVGAPEYASTWIVRAEIARAEGRIDDAREAARQAVRLAPNSPRAIVLLEALGAADREPTFADLFDEDPIEIALPKPGKLLPSRDEPVAALPPPAAPEPIESDVPNLVSETLAELLIKQGKRAEARKVYIQLARLYPERYAYFRARMDELVPSDR